MGKRHVRDHRLELGGARYSSNGLVWISAVGHRPQLLDAAERIFARDGYRGAAVTAVAAEAGYSHGAVYSNFDGKHDLFLALIEERIDARLAKVYETADDELVRGIEPLETARRFLDIVRSERHAFLLLVDFCGEVFVIRADKRRLLVHDRVRASLNGAQHGQEHRDQDRDEQAAVDE